MVETVIQRSPSQCTIATIVMATGCEYEHVLQVALDTEAFQEGVGCRDEARILNALGFSDEWKDGQNIGSFSRRHRDWCLSPEHFRSIAWGRRAIFTVPSLNNPDGHHSVYWDGANVHDPNPPEKKRYESFDQLMPSQVTLFREAG